MSSISLTKHRQSLARVRDKAAGAADAVVEPMVHAGIGAGVAFLQERMPQTLLDGKVPTLLAATALSRFLALKSSGTTRKLAVNVSNAFAVAYGLEAYKRGTFIAG